MVDALAWTAIRRKTKVGREGEKSNPSQHEARSWLFMDPPHHDEMSFRHAFRRQGPHRSMVGQSRASSSPLHQLLSAVSGHVGRLRCSCAAVSCQQAHISQWSDVSFGRPGGYCWSCDCGYGCGSDCDVGGGSKGAGFGTAIWPW
jgi:hypothetical protein